MKKETPEERVKRKAIWMERALAHGGMTDDKEELEAIIKEAEEKFDKDNLEDQSPETVSFIYNLLK